MMATGKPSYKGGWGKDVPDLNDDGSQKYEYWHWGDMQIVRWYFSKWPQVFSREPLWPHIDDDRHGHVEGLRNFPSYANLDDAAFKAETRDSYGNQLPEGFIGDKNALYGENEMGWQAPMWHALSALYDQCVGNCDCIPDRDIPDKSITVHFSCIQGVNKPGGYNTEREFGEDMYTKAPGCTRNWFWHIWYKKHLVPAIGRLDNPYTGAAIPGYDATHDKSITANKLMRMR